MLARRRLLVTTVAPGLAAALLAAGLAVPAVAQDGEEDSSEEEISDDLRDTQEQLDAARDDFTQVSQEAERAREELTAVERRLRDAAVRLQSLDDDVEVATAALERAREATQQSSERVQAADDEVTDAEAELDRVQARLDDQVRSAYMYAPKVSSRLSVAQLVTSAEDPDDVLHGSGLLERAASSEADAVADMDDLRADLVERKAELAEVRARLADQEVIAERLRTEVDGARQRQAAVQADAAADQRRADALVGQLEAAKERYEAEISSLEAESAALEEKLRASRWRAEPPAAPGGGSGGDGAAAATDDGMLLWPTAGRPGSPFGYRIHPIYGTRRLHTGVDVGAPSGQEIVAAADGLVVEAGWKGGYGNAVVIDHGGGIATLYAHQSRLAVAAGSVVSRGQVIGYIGSTGASTGPHLHLEVRVNGVPHDPLPYF